MIDDGFDCIGNFRKTNQSLVEIVLSKYPNDYYIGEALDIDLNVLPNMYGVYMEYKSFEDLERLRKQFWEELAKIKIEV